MNKKINVAIVEDDPEVSTYLMEVINNANNMACKYKYANAEDAIHFLPNHEEVQIVIVDIGLPRQNGIECVKQLKNKCSDDTQFMMYTISHRADNIFDSLKAGASGYLLKEVLAPDKIIASIIELYNEGAPMSPSIAKEITRFFQRQSHQKSPSQLEGLTADENRIVSMLSEGLIYRNIAIELDVSVNAVKQRIHRIYKKLHVHNKTEVINLYRGLGRKHK